MFVCCSSLVDVCWEKVGDACSARSSALILVHQVLSALIPLIVIAHTWSPINLTQAGFNNIISQLKTVHNKRGDLKKKLQRC